MKVSQHYDNDDDEEVSWDPERDMEEEPAHMAEAEEVEEEPPMEEVPVEEVHDDDDDLPPLPAPEGAPDAFEAFQGRQPCRCRVLASQATHHLAIVMWPCLFIFFLFPE